MYIHTYMCIHIYMYIYTLVCMCIYIYRERERYIHYNVMFIIAGSSHSPREQSYKTTETTLTRCYKAMATDCPLRKLQSPRVNTYLTFKMCQCPVHNRTPLEDVPCLTAAGSAQSQRGRVPCGEQGQGTGPRPRAPERFDPIFGSCFGL